MDSEDSDVGADYMLGFMSSEEIIDEFQHRLDSVSGAILYARINVHRMEELAFHPFRCGVLWVPERVGKFVFG